MVKKEKNKYDYVVLGGGCSGLSLAYHLNISGKLNNKTLCIVENRDSYQRDKTWSFWDFGYNPFEDCVIKKWNLFKISNPSSSTIINCKKFPYVSIDSKLFYEKTINNLKNNPNIYFLKDFQNIELNHGIVFNGIPKILKSNSFYQHFYGLEIETNNDAFDQNQLHLMDFQNTKEGVHFFYTLPFTKKKALIETTWISKNKLYSKSDYLAELECYIKNNLKIKNFNISFTEQGLLPLQHESFKTKNNEVLIGANANLLRKSTGYTFLTIQEHSKFISDNIEHILSVPKFKLKSKYNFYDEILFRVIERYPKKMPDIFRSLFTNNTNSVIKFLSSKSNLINDFLAIINLPKRYFLKALIK